MGIHHSTIKREQAARRSASHNIKKRRKLLFPAKIRHRARCMPCQGSSKKKYHLFKTCYFERNFNLNMQRNFIPVNLSSLMPSTILPVRSVVFASLNKMFSILTADVCWWKFIVKGFHTSLGLS